ncbi:MAG: flagellar basal-body rod protein FlgF [Pseudomonadota bacterium]|jgi:flagellar basal-body rod protein FlgF|nr:MAG: flagellar basal-body rod protein FlgF [Pseudomonadota bacterium]
MDRLLYVAMTGAKETLRAQGVNNHNLANASTTGFRAELSAFQNRAVTGAGFPSRVYATHSVTGWDTSAGSMISTGRSLDVAVQGDGFIAVQGRDGREAYTRAGDLRVDPSGLLLTGAGHPVLGDGGPITVPPHASIDIAADGSVSIVPLGQGPETTAVVARIKLVNPPPESLERGADGLFRTRDGMDAPADASVRLASGVLESSNVNVAEAMVTMIELARQFEMQVKMMRTAEENADASAQLLRIG